ncbi:MAG: D-glycero-beta-D-manno-heptose 1,7-bisphosphate 7-phosphatase [Deltaproteobacteria bacterium]|nr:D-glycero-beta-D-manno-heptose 1,7-bisphosphate 7-phosphatase [Deltaproteobacteria bacterium]
MRKLAVFLDRDGTINEDPGYLYKPDELVMIGGAAKAIKELNAASIKVIIVSNQSGVGRGYFTDADVEAVNEKLMRLLAVEGASIDAIYYCNHHPDTACQCRKPNTGMMEQASLEHGIDITRSYVVGDKGSDVELAKQAGAKSVLVLTGKGGSELKTLKRPADCVAKDLSEAVAWILKDLKAGR